MASIKTWSYSLMRIMCLSGWALRSWKITKSWKVWSSLRIVNSSTNISKSVARIRRRAPMIRTPLMRIRRPIMNATYKFPFGNTTIYLKEIKSKSSHVLRNSSLTLLLSNKIKAARMSKKIKRCLMKRKTNKWSGWKSGMRTSIWKSSPDLKSTGNCTININNRRWTNASKMAGV